MPRRTETLPARVAAVKLLLLDVDGVLTDGSISFLDTGAELKRFHVRDGSGLKLWQKAGNAVAILSGRTSECVVRRANELGIGVVRQGAAEKLPVFEAILKELQLEPNQVAAIGDDLPDLPILGVSGVAIGVADAVAEVRAMADYVTTTPGGHGAVREAIEWLLTFQGKWSSLIARYQPPG